MKKKKLPRNKSLWENEDNESRYYITSKQDCPKCGGQMEATFLDFEAVSEQLEEFGCESCGYIEPQACGYPRFMNRQLTNDEGLEYYHEKRPY